MCECKRGKDNKAVIASNIMYVVGQYPRFLKAHWRFLKTVVNKLFEFMHELHPGVQDMACDTFLKISKKCRREFVAQQANESKPYIEELIEGMGSITSELEVHQIYVFYEAVGFMISAEKSEPRRNLLLRGAMSIPNQKWKALMHAASQNGGQSLKTLESVKVISEVRYLSLSLSITLVIYHSQYLSLKYNITRIQQNTLQPIQVLRTNMPCAEPWDTDIFPISPQSTVRCLTFANYTRNTSRYALESSDVTR